MSMTPIGMYHASAAGLAVTDTGDFFQLRAVGVIAVIHEVRVWQENLVTLELNTIVMGRDSTGGGAAGSALTEREFSPSTTAPASTTHSLPTTDVDAGTLTWDLHCGWNILQEFVWLPTPAMRVAVYPDDDFGISLRVAPSGSQTTGVSVIWEEFQAV